MLAGFLVLTLLIVLIAIISLYTLNNIRYATNIDRSINQLQSNTLILIKSDDDFFDIGATDSVYFKSHYSNYIVKRDSLNKKIQLGLTVTIQRLRSNATSIELNFATIQNTLATYNQKFLALEGLLYQKGFRDYGMEGQMRLHAHQLEHIPSAISMVDLLSLRRHEKDFFLRNDFAYVIQLNDLAQQFRQKLVLGKNSLALQHLNEYVNYFNRLVSIQTQIGIDSQSGLRHELNLLTDKLSQEFLSLSEYSSREASTTQRNAFFYFGLLVTVAVFISLFSSFWLAKRLSSPIARLSRMMNTAIREHNVKQVDFSLNNAAQEINILTFSFLQLIEQTNGQLKEIEKKSSLLEKGNEELKKLNQELDSFIYSTAHDLRSPLTSLLGLLHLAKMESTQPDLKTYFDMMESSIHRMEDFISQIVGYSKNKRLELAPENVNVYLLISEIFESHRFVEGASKIEMLVEVKDKFPFYSDRARIWILFNNLISNAIRYSDTSKVHRYIKINVVINETEIFIEFSDNGVGIGIEHIGKIFNMFYRANTKSKGSGLGLFIFKETIAKLKGLVTVESELGIGTKFVIQLPNLYLKNAGQSTLALTA
jgi:signal transduction histidine kinase